MLHLRSPPSLSMLSLLCNEMAASSCCCRASFLRCSSTMTELRKSTYSQPCPLACSEWVRSCPLACSVWVRSWPQQSTMTKLRKSTCTQPCPLACSVWVRSCPLACSVWVRSWPQQISARVTLTRKLTGTVTWQLTQTELEVMNWPRMSRDPDIKAWSKHKLTSLDCSELFTDSSAVTLLSTSTTGTGSAAGKATVGLASHVHAIDSVLQTDRPRRLPRIIH